MRSAEEAIAWLTDWLGRTAHVETCIAYSSPDQIAPLLSAFGELRYWDHEADPHPSKLGDAIREAMFGTYSVAGAHFTIGEPLPVSRFTLDKHADDDGGTLHVALAGGVELRITRERTPVDR